MHLPESINGVAVIDLLSTLSEKLRGCAHLVKLLARNRLLEVELIVGSDGALSLYFYYRILFSGTLLSYS